ncbi:MAG: SDR family oxidoreductase [Acidobacteria bacterium]|nr:SDR family oxidoreductase [Acidobacteriota bacterium]
MQASDKSPSHRPVALITGASSGIGAQFARALAAGGHDLVLVARRRERLEELAGRLHRDYGVEARVEVADLARDEDTESVAGRIASEERLELLVNNAGFGVLGNFAEAGLDAQARMHRLHVLTTMRLTHAALPGLIARNRGGVINVSSVAGFIRLPGNVSYNSTKAWMNAFSESLALELESVGSRVRVQALCPGFTYTEFHDVAGLDRKQIMPRPKWWLTAEFVVAESLKGLARGDWLVIPGWRYRLLVFFLKTMPGLLLRRAAMNLMRRRARSTRGKAGAG